MSSKLTALLVLAAAVTAASTAHAEEATDLKSMVTDGDINLDFRYRYEHVDDSAVEREANASTLRSRVTFASAALNGFSVLFEADNIAHIGSARFNDTTNGKTEYPVVADPKGTEFNQAWARYAGRGASGTYGRQRINHGNQRFIGGVAWRQNEQTFDGFRAKWDSESGVVGIDYAYVYNIRRIFGPDGGVQAPNWRGDNHFLRGDFAFGDKKHKLAAYFYEIDIRERGEWPGAKSVDNSNRTAGVEYDGEIGTVVLRAAFAQQTDTGDSNLDYDTDYYNLEAGIKFAGSWQAKLGYEVLAADNGVGFKTPLATLHKFQGFADKFLNTPGDGVEDAYVGLNGGAGPVKLGFFYHDFQAEDSSADFGKELDMVVTWPFAKHWSLQFKYADFQTDNKARFSDTKKAWATLQLKI